MGKKRPPTLVAIICYKAFVAGLLTITSIALLLALNHYDRLENYAAQYLLESKYGLIHWFLNKVLNLTPKTLLFSGVGAAMYAAVTAVEAVGLWYEKTWAKVLVIVLVATSVPLEIYELIRGFSLLKTFVFIINVAMLVYLVTDFRREFFTPHDRGSCTNNKSRDF